MVEPRQSPRTMPDGSPAWFVRTAAAGRFTINPCSRQGWLVMAAWSVATLLPIPLVLTRHVAGYVGFVVVELCLALLLVVVTLRTSAPLPKKESRK